MFIKSIMPVDDGTVVAVADEHSEDVLPLICWGIVTDEHTMHDTVVGFVYKNGEPGLLPCTELHKHGIDFIGYGNVTFDCGVDHD